MREKESVIHNLYYGTVCPWEGRMPHTEEWARHSKKLYQCYEAVRGMLKEEQVTVFEEFLSINGEMESRWQEERFKAGFILGVRLLMETLEDDRFHHN